MPKISLRSVLDGNTFDMPDDGHAKGDAQRSNARRQVIERTIEKRSKDDGGPSWFAVNPQSPWSVDGVPMQPIKHLLIWNPECDRRLEEHLQARKSRTSDRAAALPSRVARANEAIEHEKQKIEIKESGTGEARAVVNSASTKGSK